MFLDGENDARFVVGPHQRNDGGVVADRGGGLGRVELAVGIDGQPGDLVAAPGEGFAEVLGRAVLDGGGDDVPAVAVGGERALDRGVVALAAAAGEDDFLRLATEQRRDLFARGLDGPAHARAEAVGARRVAVELGQVRQHRVDDGGVEGGGGVVVEVEEVVSRAVHGRLSVYAQPGAVASAGRVIWRSGCSLR